MLWICLILVFSFGLHFTSGEQFQASVIKYDAVEVNLPNEDLNIIDSVLFINQKCSSKVFSQSTLNEFNGLTIERSVLSVFCSSTSKLSFSLLGMFFVLAVQLSFRQLFFLSLIIVAGVSVQHVDALYIPVSTNQQTIIFNDFADLYNPTFSISEMTVLSGNPAANGTSMTLLYDPVKKFEFYFPQGDKYVVIKDNLVQETTMYPSGVCATTTSQFFKLLGYSYISGLEKSYPGADCFLIYTDTLNPISVCIKNQKVVYFRNNQYALVFSKELDSVPVSDNAFCQNQRRFFNECQSGTSSYDPCQCCISLTNALIGVAGVTCAVISGGIGAAICGAVAVSLEHGSAAQQDICPQLNYC